MYLGGIGKARIGRILTGEGVLIPTNYKRDVLNVNYHNANQKYDTDSKWSFQTINTILHNEVYIGNMVQNKSCKKSYKDKGKENVPKKEWIRVENTHEPIIDFKVFQKVQKLLNERTHSIDISCLNKSLFANRLFCGDCGRPMTPCYSKRNKAGERHRKYICSDYKKFGNKYCSSHSILEETLKNIILNDLRIQSKILLTDEARVSLHDFRCISSIKNRSDKIKQLNDAQQKTQNYKQRAFENFADGILSKPEYMSLKEKYDKREKQLLQDIKEYNELHMEQSTIRDFEYWLENFTDDFSIDEITREMVLELIDSIYIYDNKTITINYKFQFNPKSNPSSKKMKRTMCGIS